MKPETHRRIRNIIRILKRGEIGTAVWETGYYRIIFWGSPNNMRPIKAVRGHLRLP